MSASLIGLMFHAPDGVPRQVRNSIYQGRSAERYYDALEWSSRRQSTCAASTARAARCIAA